MPRPLRPSSPRVPTSGRRVFPLRRSRGRALRWLATALALAGSTAAAGDANATIKSNTQIRLHGQAALGDVDGDGLQDLVFPAGNRILATRVSAHNTGILHYYQRARATRIVMGRFAPGAADEVCALLDDGKMRCLRASASEPVLEDWFEQRSPISAKDEAIVADFDGDGRDDILKYRPSTGELSLLSYNARVGEFVPNRRVSFGITAKQARGKQLRAGEFDGTTARADLLVWDQRTGRVSRYDTVEQGDGFRLTHRFTTNRVVSAGETLHVANTDGSALDGVALSRPSGEFRFFRAERAGKGLRADSKPQLGQLMSKGGGLPVFGHFEARDAEPGRRRDDVLFHDPRKKRFTRINARWDARAKRHTYWWSYTGPRPTVHEGWPERTIKTAVVARCWTKRTESSSSYPRAEHSHYEALFGIAGRGQHALWDYVRDVSYGTVFIDAKLKRGWKPIDYTAAKLRERDENGDKKFGRKARMRPCLEAWDIDPDDYDTKIVIYDQKVDYGAKGSWMVLDKGGADRLPSMIHEVLHTFGLPHAYDDSGRRAQTWSSPGGYYDEFDPMGGRGLRKTDGPLGKRPPHTNGHYKSVLGMLPSTRVESLTSRASRRSTVVKMAPLTRPEVNGPMMVRIDLRNSDDELVIEYRTPWGWDAKFSEPLVLVRRVNETPATADVGKSTQGRVTTLHRDDPGPALTEGESMTWEGVTVEVEEADAAEGRGHVRIRY